MVLFPAGKDKMNTMDDQLLGNKERRYTRCRLIGA
jgi:hypothetical protein